MATVMKRPSGKWQATVRKDGRSCSKSFTKRVEANKWARNTELKAESVGLQQTSAPAIEEMTLGQVLERYRHVSNSGSVVREPNFVPVTMYRASIKAFVWCI